LLGENTILASPDCSSLFPNGEVTFIEDRQGPPSRAYLKLYEALTLMQKHPQPGEFCVDAGGSPGGWAWVVQQLGAQVLTVDRATPEPKILSLPNVKFRKGDVFALSPADFDQVDWLLSDVVCFPNKLLEWASMWVESGKCENLVCTIKFKGKTDYGIVKKILEIGGSRVAHLHHNRHELTWMHRPNWP
jgi:23S rRNA (cytidine2498-2'-O)-methyltransferase